MIVQSELTTADVADYRRFRTHNSQMYAMRIMDNISKQIKTEDIWLK